VSPTRTRSKSRTRRSPGAVLGTIVGALVALGVAAFLLYLAFSGGPLFGGSTNRASGISFDKIAVANSGRIPYSADQWVLLMPATFALAIALGLVLSLVRPGSRLGGALSTIVPAVIVLESLGVLVFEIVWAATGHSFSNYISKFDNYPRSYVFPIGISAIIGILAAAAFVVFRRLSRRSPRPRR
jgi:hypothetical protein